MVEEIFMSFFPFYRPYTPGRALTLHGSSLSLFELLLYRPKPSE